MTIATRETQVLLRRPHPAQERFLASDAKRIVIRAGRRGGKTTGLGILAVQRFLEGRRILYAAPTQDQVSTFWFEVKRALAETCDAGVFRKNESLHIVENPGTKQRLRAKTAWNADSLRGDYADLLILDEWQLMDEEAWGVVGAPMLMDNNGDAVFVYTPPSLSSRSASKARDPLHAAKMFSMARADTTGRWAAFHFTSRENPHISEDAIAEIAQDMTSLAYRQEIEAEDINEAPGALWKREWLDAHRVAEAPDLSRLVVAIDPTGSAGGDEAGIMAGGVAQCSCQGEPQRHGFLLRDLSGQYSPNGWASRAVTAYRDLSADKIVAERNFGGDMVEQTIRTIDSSVNIKTVTASRGKQVRAEPVAALYEKGKIHHVGHFPHLEDQLCQWEPGMASPDRLDAVTWLWTELMVTGGTPNVRWLG